MQMCTYIHISKRRKIEKGWREGEWGERGERHRQEKEREDEDEGERRRAQGSRERANDDSEERDTTYITLVLVNHLPQVKVSSKRR